MIVAACVVGYVLGAWFTAWLLGFCRGSGLFRYDEIAAVLAPLFWPIGLLVIASFFFIAFGDAVGSPKPEPESPLPVKDGRYR